MTPSWCLIDALSDFFGPWNVFQYILPATVKRNSLWMLTNTLNDAWCGYSSFVDMSQFVAVASMSTWIFYEMISSYSSIAHDIKDSVSVSMMLLALFSRKMYTRPEIREERLMRKQVAAFQSIPSFLKKLRHWRPPKPNLVMTSSRASMCVPLRIRLLTTNFARFSGGANRKSLNIY